MNEPQVLDLDKDLLPPRPGTQYGIGCIGAGGIMRNCHLVAYRNAGFRVVAISDLSAQTARETATLRGIPCVYATTLELLDDPQVEILDIAVPPDQQLEVVRQAVLRPHIKGILAQKPLAVYLEDARRIVELCDQAGKKLAVNQNMRYEASTSALRALLRRGMLGEPVMATLEMRVAIPWQPFISKYGRVMILNMSIHHLDLFRFLFGEPERVLASARTNPALGFPHQDGIGLYTLEYADGLRAAGWDIGYTGPGYPASSNDSYWQWRVEGTEGVAWGTVNWAEPSAITYLTARQPSLQFQPRLTRSWAPDAFEGVMAELLCAVEQDREPQTSGHDNLKTMAVIEACYRSLAEHRAVSVQEILGDS